MFLVVIWPCFWIDHHRKQAQLYIKHFLCKVNSPFFTLRTGNVRKIEIFHSDHWDDMAQSPVETSYVEIPFIEQLKGMSWDHIEGDIDVPYIMSILGVNGKDKREQEEKGYPHKGLA